MKEFVKWNEGREARTEPAGQPANRWLKVRGCHQYSEDWLSWVHLSSPAHVGVFCKVIFCRMSIIN